MGIFKFSRVIFGVVLILSIFVTRSSNLQLPHPCTILHLLVPGREKSQKFQEVETDTMHKSGMVRARGHFFFAKIGWFCVQGQPGVQGVISIFQNYNLGWKLNIYRRQIVWKCDISVYHRGNKRPICLTDFCWNRLSILVLYTIPVNKYTP